MGDTVDNTLIKFKLHTFISLVIGIVFMTFTVSGFYFTTMSFNDRLTSEINNRKSEDKRNNDRVSRITKRQEQDIKELKIIINELKNNYNESI